LKNDNQILDDIEIGFREDPKQEKTNFTENEAFEFENEFFESFKKGPFNNNTNQKEEEEDIGFEDSPNYKSKKGSKRGKKISSEENLDSGPVDFQSNIFIIIFS